MGGRAVEAVRAGALAGGVATLAMLFTFGLGEIHLYRWPNPIDAAVCAVVAVAFGATLGFREPASSLGGRVARIVIALLGVAVVGALQLGLSFVLVRGLGVREARLPFVFLATAIALCAFGAQRLPSSRGARVALFAALSLLLAFRLSLLSRSFVRGMEKRLFPLSTERVRQDFEKNACGHLCRDGRARLVAFEQQPTYRDEEGSLLTADAAAKATLELQKPVFVDDCGQPYDAAPSVPEWVTKYETRSACEKEHVIEVIPYSIGPRPIHRVPDPSCCYVRVTPRAVGERVDVQRRLRFVFYHLRWWSELEPREPLH